MAKLIQNYDTFIANFNRVITNYGSFDKNYAKKMLQTTPKIYLIKLRLLKFPRLINDYYKLR